MVSIAGGAVHIGSCDRSGNRPINYTRGQLPIGETLGKWTKWVGNEHHGWTGMIVLTRCDDGLWLSWPQATHANDWASYLVSHPDTPAWVGEKLKVLESL